MGRPVPVKHSLLLRRNLWCLLRVEVNGEDLQFSTPQQLDIVIDTLSHNPMPSRTTRSFHGPNASRKNRHNHSWFSGLPAKAESTNWREQFVAFVARAKPVQEFRDFYAADPPVWRCDGQNPDGLFYCRAQAVRHYPESNMNAVKGLS